MKIGTTSNSAQPGSLLAVT